MQTYMRPLIWVHDFQGLQQSPSFLSPPSSVVPFPLLETLVRPEKSREANAITGKNSILTDGT